MSSTKIHDFSTNLMANAMSSLKESKTKKAESAFYSLLDSAVNGNNSNNKTDSFQKIASKNQNSDKDVGTDGFEKSVSDPNNHTQNLKAEQSGKTEGADMNANGTAADKTKLDKAEEVIAEICEELGLTPEELFAQFDQLLSTIASMLMEKFNLSEQDLCNALNELGLSMTDLFQQTDIRNLVVALTGAEDISAVLTDESLYQQIQEVTKEMNTLLESFADGKELDAASMKSLEESIETVVAAAEPIVQEEQGDIQQQERIGKPVMTEATAVEEPSLEMVIDKPNSGNAEGRKTDGQPMTGNEGFQQFTGRVAEFMDAAVAAADEAVQQVDMESIIKQVTDYVKMQVHAETTSLEMQLHPESYGKLNLHVSVRDGVVTARMAVENEMVKSALEAQVVQLREDMNERGLKVDAVEVTIASHEFERNLEEGQGNQESAQEETPGTRRRINLNLQESDLSLEELAEMSEAEALTRKMMLENGNSIDYSA